MLSWLRAMVIAAAFVVPASEGSAAGDKRIALVIGNSSYKTVRSLANPQNDARAIAKTLKSLDFQAVEVVQNQSANAMRDTIQRFSRQAAQADVALVYYAGHAIELAGRNYLVPIDAQLNTDMDVAFEAVALDLVQQAVGSAKSLRIIILDACRDNPFANRMTITSGANCSVGRGLARVDPPGETLVAYAAKAGSTAADGTGSNSPFTTALLKHLPTPGLDIRLMLGRVRDTVMELTNGQQEPFVYGSIGGREVYLKAPAGGQPPASSASAARPQVAAPGPPPAPAPDTASERARIETPGRIASTAPTAPAPSAAPGNFQKALFPSVGREPIRIAVAGPMTGPDAAYGARLRTGVEQAVADLNARGGILGRQIVLSVADDFSNPRLVTSLATRLAGDGVKVVIGHFNAALATPAAQVYQDKNILQITPSASHPELTERGMWNVFRTCGRDDQQGAVAGDYIAQNFKSKKVAIVHDRSSYGHALAEDVRKAINAKAIKEVLYETVNAGEKDFSALIGRVRAAGADLIYWGGLSTEGGVLLRQLRDQGVKTPVMGGDGIVSDELASSVGLGVEGTLMTSGPDARKRPEAKGLLQKLRGRKIEPDAHMLNSYAAIEVVKQAAEAAKSFDPKALAATMKSGLKFKTVIGEIAFDQKGDVARPSYTVFVWRKDASGRMTYTEAQ